MVQIVDLPLATSLATDDLLPVEQDGVLKRVTQATLVASVVIPDPDAMDIPYDNGSSGLAADDVQAALDELAAASASGVADGDKGDITVSGSGSIWTVDAVAEGTLPSGINANKIASGNVSNTEFDYLNGVTSALQTQLNTITTDNTGDQNIFKTIAVSGQSNVVADTTSDTLTLAAGSNITITTVAGTDTITIASTSAGLSDSDYGDIAVSSSGTVMTIDNGAVTYAKMQDVSATDLILGRSTAGSGDVEEIACTAAGRALLDDANAAAQRTTLGLGTLATQSGTFSGTSSGTNTGDQNVFTTIAVSGQSNVVSDAASDTLTLVAGTGIAITTDASTDAITIATTGGGAPTPTAITVADTTDSTCFVALFESATGDLEPKTDGNATYNATTGVLTAAGFAGPLTGNVTGNVSGTSGSTTGNAATVTVGDAASDTTTWILLGTSQTGSLAPATDSSLTYNALTNALSTTSFVGDLTGNAATVTVADAGADTTTWVLLGTSQTGSLAPATDAGLTYNASTDALTATTFIGAVSGNATTASTLATGRTIGGVTFDGSINIVPQTIQSVNEATDTTCFPLFITNSGTQSLQPMNNTALTFNSNTGVLGATTFSGAGTSLTGTAASLTAGTVTTNANLTGVITSSGNATSIASQTGTGTKFVVDNTPTLITPNIGVATGTSLAASGVMSTGANSGTNGQITFSGSTSGSCVVKTAAAAGTATVFQLPADNGTNTYVLQTNGSGVTSWVAGGAGGISLGAVLALPFAVP